MADKQKSKRAMTVEEAEAALFESRKAAALAALKRELTVTLPVAAVLLKISKAHAYDLVRENAFPVPIIKLGKTVRIPTRSLRDLLGIEGSEPSPEASPRPHKRRSIKPQFDAAAAPPTV
jgi:predicted DNA-binding transcriptional regulator AlpA